LEDNNVSEIKIKPGDKFDPATMEAIADANLRMECESTNKKEGENQKGCVVKKVLQRGYKIGDRVIRAARVVVE